MMIGPAYADTIQELYESGTAPESIPCKNPDHHIALRDNGKLICATEMTLEMLGLDAIQPVVAEDAQPVVAEDIRLAESPPICGESMAKVSEAGPDAVIPADVATANNNFAVSFYKQISGEGKNHGQNLFISPLSIYTAFAMLHETALGSSSAQLADVFEFDSDMASRHGMMAQTVGAVNREDPQATLDMANALWVSNTITPFESLVDITGNVYDADAEQLDFRDKDASAARLNEWAAENTRDKIPEIVIPPQLESNTKAILTNAVYFNATWKFQFFPERTHTDDFWISQNYASQAEFMIRNGHFEYASTDGVSLLRMPYLGDRFSMIVILPDEVDGIESLTEQLSAEQIAGWMDAMKNEKVTVTIPKFTTKGSYDLKPSLIEMGVTDVFDAFGADLSCISPEVMALENPDLLPASLRGISFGEPYYVYKAQHDTFVDVHEAGTEAAAVTAVYVVGVVSGTPSKIFKADHPFLFAIQDDQSGTILFMGRIMDPAAG